MTHGFKGFIDSGVRLQAHTILQVAWIHAPVFVDRLKCIQIMNWKDVTGTSQSNTFTQRLQNVCWTISERKYLVSVPKAAKCAARQHCLFTDPYHWFTNKHCSEIFLENNWLPVKNRLLNFFKLTWYFMWSFNIDWWSTLIFYFIISIHILKNTFTHSTDRKARYVWIFFF